MPQISVIVPVYNVEPYLPQCLDSILAQTYRDLEIILVDDGSTDRCGQICDNYGAKDRRIQVIHQENRGASAARNRGIQAARGAWLGFIDSDDWIAPEFYETLFSAAQEYSADIACCSFCYNGIALNREKPITVFDGREVLYQLLEREYGATSLCNKLFRAELKDFLHNREDIHFNEDFAASYEVCQHAKRMVFVSKPFYHYTTKESGCVEGYTPEDNQLAVRLAVERAEREKADPHAYNLCLRHCITMRLREINQAIKYGQYRGTYRQMRRETLADYRSMSNRRVMNRRERYMVWLLHYGPALYPAVVKAKFRYTKC